MNSNHSQILNVHERWIAAEQINDKKILASLLDEELCCVLPGGGRISGKAAFFEMFGDGNPRIQKIEISDMWISIGSDRAIMVADYRTHFSDRSLAPISGSHVWGLKALNGQWKIQMITWTIRGEQVGLGNSDKHDS